MRDKLAKLIFDCWLDYVNDADGRAPTAEQYADYLIANGVKLDVPETNVEKWIPVSERLPEPRCSIEMYFPSKEMVCLGFLEKVAHLDIWCIYTPNNSNVCQINPTHWRYRAIIPASPEPPKEGE